MLLEKWSTSYLRSTMLKHKPHTAKLKITARNSSKHHSTVKKQQMCFWRPGSSVHWLGRAAPPPQPAAQGQLRLTRVAAPGAQPALTFQSIPGHNCDASGLGTTQSPPSSHASSAHRPHCTNGLGTDAKQTKNLVFISSGQPMYCQELLNPT